MGADISLSCGINAVVRALHIDCLIGPTYSGTTNFPSMFSTSGIVAFICAFKLLKRLDWGSSENSKNKIESRWDINKKSVTKMITD